ncbi:MAG: RNA polymerase sigma factor [Armatimonadota bacterium]
MIDPERERRLVERFRGGDLRAMEMLFDIYVDRALGFACRQCDRREDAEEVVQEAFLRAFAKCRQIRDDTVRFGPWLFAIVRSISADRRRQLRLPEVSFELAQSIAGDGGTEEEVLERERRRGLFSAIDRLPEDQQVVVVLCDLEEIPHADVAQIVGKSVAATKSLLYRGRRTLHRLLMEMEVFA